jgi:hypothetical protein
VCAWWRKSVSLIVLSVFTGLPVSGLVCAIDCAAEARSTTVASGAARMIESTADHDCQHGDLAAAAFLTAVRADTAVLSATHAIIATPFAALAPLAGDAQARPGAPPGPVAPARPPVVLRI